MPTLLGAPDELLLVFLNGFQNPTGLLLILAHLHPTCPPLRHLASPPPSHPPPPPTQTKPVQTCMISFREGTTVVAGPLKPSLLSNEFALSFKELLQHISTPNLELWKPTNSIHPNFASTSTAAGLRGHDDKTDKSQ